MEVNIRTGKKEDLPQALDLVKELALYEKAPDEVINTVALMEEDGFGMHPIFGFFVAEKNNRIVGIAIYYWRYSTWKGKMLYLDDLVVQESYRQHKIGSQLFNALIAIAQIENVNQVRWQVLDWNEPAIKMYKKIEADFYTNWWTCKFESEKIKNYKPI